MAGKPAEVLVWDPVVRVLHWSLALSVIGAWITHEVGGSIHEILGYAALAFGGLRVVWGMLGTGQARWSAFLRSPARSWEYALQVWHGEEKRHLGHNPLGGWMIVALLLTIAGVCASGWLYTTDRFWGEEWVEDIHEGLTNVLLTLVALHVAGVIFSSLRHGENLARAMISGRKRVPAPGDVE